MTASGFTHLLLLCLLITACSAEESEFDSIQAPEIVTSLEFEINDSDEVLFGQIADISIDSNDRILVLDPSGKKIHLFNENGGFLDNSLNEGRGPGEVQSTAYQFHVSPDNRVILHDQGLQRLSIYDISDNNLQHIRDINLDIFPANYHLSPEDKIYLHSSASSRQGEETDRIIILNLEGEVIDDSFLEFEKGDNLKINNLNGISSMSISSAEHVKNLFLFTDEMIIHNRSGEIEFTAYDITSGEPIHQVNINRPDVPYPIEERREFINSFGERLGLGRESVSDLVSDMPETKAVVQKLLFNKENNSVWMNILDTGDDIDWLIFSDSGELTGRFNQDFEGSILAVDDGNLYVQSEDENESPFIQVYSYQFQ